MKSCISPSGIFIYGRHTPCYSVRNLRESDHIEVLGVFDDQNPHKNRRNFPPGEVHTPLAEPVYEIYNPFDFRGATYILKSGADARARNPSLIGLPQKPPLSFTDTVESWHGNKMGDEKLDSLFKQLPDAVLLALAVNSTDSRELVRIAGNRFDFVYDSVTGQPTGLFFEKDDNGKIRLNIDDCELFEALANNPHLPDDYKRVMVLKPGAQGDSEIVGDYRDKDTHVYEYLRKNSYIPWGHYAANMAEDAIRYHIESLNPSDMTGMRHLYYQRTYIRMAEDIGITVYERREVLSADQLEELRKRILDRIRSPEGKVQMSFSSELWGWNFGFDYSPGRYRLHASHQQIHQQYALIPDKLPGKNIHNIQEMELKTFAYGDLIADFISRYRRETGRPFFSNYINAVRNNRRMDDGNSRETSLVVYEDDNVMLFVPKAQTSQWELQLMTLKPVGNILEADSHVRSSLDYGIHVAVSVLEKLGARMITMFEASKRFDSNDSDQRLMVFFLPKLPYSPGSFTEAQLRWINNHYPEDFAFACRLRLKDISADNRDR